MPNGKSSSPLSTFVQNPQMPQPKTKGNRDESAIHSPITLPSLSEGGLSLLLYSVDKEGNRKNNLGSTFTSPEERQ